MVLVGESGREEGEGTEEAESEVDGVQVTGRLGLFLGTGVNKSS